MMPKLLHDFLRLEKMWVGLSIRLHEAIDAKVQIAGGVLAPEVPAKGPDALAIRLGFHTLIDPVPNKAALQHLV